MTSPRDPRGVTRRFLQARRRAPLPGDGVADLLTADVEYVESIEADAVSITGAEAVVSVLQAFWDGLPDASRLVVVRQQLLDDGTVIGHWHLDTGDRIINGRDTYTLRDDRISQIVVEEFAGAEVPRPLRSQRAVSA